MVGRLVPVIDGIIFASFSGSDGGTEPAGFLQSSISSDMGRKVLNRQIPVKKMSNDMCVENQVHLLRVKEV